MRLQEIEAKVPSAQLQYKLEVGYRAVGKTQICLSRRLQQGLANCRSKRMCTEKVLPGIIWNIIFISKGFSCPDIQLNPYG